MATRDTGVCKRRIVYEALYFFVGYTACLCQLIVHDIAPGTCSISTNHTKGRTVVQAAETYAPTENSAHPDS